jgi:outer membrane protein assembly factor BamB
MGLPRRIAWVVVVVSAVVVGGEAPHDEAVAFGLAQPVHWVPNGNVDALLRVDDTLFVAGGFTRFTPPTGPLAAVDGRGELINAFPRAAGGTVQTMVPDGRGGWFLGGSFTHVGGAEHRGVAHVLANGSVDQWRPVVEGVVHAIAPGPQDVFIGGEITAVNGIAVTGLAAVDRATGATGDWRPRLRPFRVTDPLVVLTVALRGETVFAGGSFVTLSRGRRALAAFDARTGAIRAWNARIQIDPCFEAGICSVRPVVSDLELVGSSLYLGGHFDHVGGRPRELAASVRIVDGQVLPWRPRVGMRDGAVVSAIVRVGSSVALAGRFTSVGSSRRSNFAVVDRVRGAPLAVRPAINGPVFDVAASGRVAYVVGSFTRLGATVRPNAAAVDLRTGRVLRWNPQPAGTATAVAVRAGKIVLGGDFTGLGGVARSSLAALDATTGELRPWAPRVQRASFESLTALATDGERLFVGGDFTSVNGAPRRGLAAFRLSDLVLLPWRADISDNSPWSIEALAVAAGTLFVGGEFESVRGQPAGSFAALDAETGARRLWGLDLADEQGESASIEALATDGVTVLAGGKFTSVGDYRSRYVAAIDARAGTFLRWDDEPGDVVNAVALDGSTAYAGGVFRQVSGVPRFGLAAFGAHSGELLAWNPIVDVDGLCFDCVSAVVVDGSVVYVGGDFTAVGGVGRGGLAALDVGTGSPLPWNPLLEDELPNVGAIVAGDPVWVGGSFAGVGGAPLANLAAVEPASPERVPKVGIEPTRGSPPTGF